MLAISLPLQSTLLRTSFRPVRNYLLGKPATPQLHSHKTVEKAMQLAETAKARHTVVYPPQKPVVNPASSAKSSSQPLATVIVTREKQSESPKASKSLINISKHEKIDKKSSTFSFKKRLTTILFLFFVVSSITIVSVLFAPVVYFKFFSHDPVPVHTVETGTPQGGDFDKGTQTPARKIALPAYDETLPEGNWLIIPRIGVRTEILEGETPDEALQKGVWRVPDFGQPGDLNKPIILAAHRYGYNWWWKGQYWRYHSFYLLPQLQPGDLVEVISGKRKYMYEIYGGEEGEEISDYDADMILYTCKFLNSPLRHFRYARLIDPNTSTQGKQASLDGTSTSSSTASGSLKKLE